MVRNLHKSHILLAEQGSSLIHFISLVEMIWVSLGVGFSKFAVIVLVSDIVGRF